MKLADRPTPETDRWANQQDDFASPHDASKALMKMTISLEKRLAHAVEALKKIADYQCIQPMDETAREALAEIEEGK